MLFDVQAALAEILASPIATPATNGPSVAKVADVAAYQPQVSEPPKVVTFAPPPKGIQPACIPSRDDRDAYRHGRAFDGRPKTWTGRVVSLDEWRKLSDWDRHGSTDKLFCGACREWVMPGGCPHCDGGAV